MEDEGLFAHRHFVLRIFIIFYSFIYFVEVEHYYSRHLDLQDFYIVARYLILWSSSVVLVIAEITAMLLNGAPAPVSREIY